MADRTGSSPELSLPALTLNKLISENTFKKIVFWEQYLVPQWSALTTKIT